jgi:hypothetical protein
MNRAERRAAFAAAVAHPQQQICQCGYLWPRETYVELWPLADGSGPPPCAVTITILCPVCSQVASVEVPKAADA